MSAPVQNILFIMCDQLRHDALSCSGGVIDTPNLDALALRGLRFDRAFVQGSVCGSSRMSTYTGRYVQSHGARYNQVPLSVSQRTMGDHLRPLGVRTALIGKTHMAIDHSGLDRLRLKVDDPATRVINECGFEPILRDDGLVPATSPERFDSEYNTFLRAHGYAGDNPWHTAANSVINADGERISGWLLSASAYPAIVPDELSETAYMTDRAIEFMRANIDDSWCLHLSYIKPHWPYVVSEPYSHMVDPLDLPAPNRADRELNTTHPVLRAFRESRIGKTFSDDEVRRTVYPAYLGLVAQLDHHLGRLFAAMTELGLSEYTLIVLTSDHGDYLGDHWMGEKDWLHEEVVRVPLIIADPREAADCTRGSVSSALVEAIDLAPTFIDAFGGSVEDNLWLEGSSLQPELHGLVDPKDRSVAFCESEFSFLEMAADLPGGSTRSRRATMIRSERFKYILSETGPNLLYDLEEDPGEFDDRANDPAMSSVVAELHEQLFAWYRGRSHEVTERRGARPLVEGDAARAGVFIGYWDLEDAGDADACDFLL